MIQGELKTMSLADLLQWADQSRVEGCLTLSREGATTWLLLKDRRIVGASEPPSESSVLSEFGADREQLPWLRLTPETQAIERLVDLFLEDTGTFRLDDGPPRSDGVQVSQAIQPLVFEGLRARDELPGILRRFPEEGACFSVTGEDTDSPLGPVERVLLRCAARKMSLGEARVSLVLSRSALLRHVHNLFQLGLIEVEGSAAGPDPIGRLLTQAQALLGEEQYDEAIHVLDSLLQADPTDQQVRRLMKAAVEEQMNALYEDLPPGDLLEHTGATPQGGRLGPHDEVVYDLVDSSRPVATVVMLAPMREMETLKAISRLVTRGLVRLRVNS